MRISCNLLHVVAIQAKEAGMNDKSKKGILRLIVLGILLLPMVSYSQDTITKSDYKRIGDLVYYNDSIFSGIAIKKAENGQIIVEEHFENGLAHGLWKEWYKTGEKKFEGAFVNGKNDGVWIQWFADGKIQRKLTFKNGQIILNEE
ncbi:MAG: hypothetical protein CVU05_11805 [Bacteroidetes bacterium HGW-Bacteroidetes-21]|jgi:hypothetical protein|nr:MAG: hypothetical protein CVU05_11805 [Bacteroidetes bacterium HGW-Bacteroidetes-21]